MRYLGLLWRCLLVTALFVLIATSSYGEDDLIGRVRDTYNDIGGFAADFTQSLKSAASGESDIRVGKLYYKKPNLVRWETLKPERELFMVTGEAVWEYYPEEATAIKYPLEAVLQNKTMIRFISGAARLDEEFEITELGEQAGLMRLELAPLNPEPTMVVAYAWVDPETALLRRIEIIDFFGNANLLVLDDLELDPDHPDGRFEFDPPEETEIIDNTGA